MRQPSTIPRRSAARLGGLLAALALCALAAGQVGAQTGRLDGQIVQELEISGLETLSAETVEHYLFGTDGVVGRPLDAAALDRRLRRLWRRQLVDDVEVTASEATGGIRLEVRVVERPVLTSIEYVGLDRVNESDVREQADRDRIQAYEGEPLQRGELERLARAVEDLYKEKGFRFATATVDLATAGRGQRTATITVDEGDKVKIGDIDFDGNTVFGDFRLRLAMKDTKESGLLTRITKKDIYNPATIDEDLERIRDMYKKAGYKDVLIARPEVDVVARRPDAATIEEQGRRLAITVPIEEGERWKLGEISIEGNEVFSDDLLLAQFEDPRGGWLRSKKIDEGVESIDQLYSSIGYIFAQVGTELREQSDNVADVIVKIDESDQFRVGRIEFRGNTKTRDKVLRRELLLQEGTVMNMTAVQNSLLKIRQLNYFAVEEEEPIKFDFDSDDKTVDLLIVGDEAERTELQFGGGWSEVDGFFGQFSLRTTNFLGRGETVGVSVQAGRERQYYDLEYRVPWFRDKPQSIGVRLFNQEFDSDILEDVEFRSSYAGASITYGRSFRNFQSISMTYSFADVEDTRVLRDPENPGVELRDESVFISSTFRPFWIRNTLDSRFEPSRGLRTTASIEYASEIFGGETEYIKPEIGVTWFQPVTRQRFRSSVGVNFEAGYIEELRDPEDLDGDGFEDPAIFPQQRFFLGGDNSVRGFRRRSIVVRNDDGTIRRDESNFPLGGDLMALINLEYHVQAGGPFRLVLFGDAGGVFAEASDFEFDRFRYSAGAELRIRVPIFPAPLRFIYASNLDPLPGDRFESFDFSLSTSF